MTDYVLREEREPRAADELYLDSLIGRASEQRGPFYGGAHRETLFYDRVGPGPACFACGRAPSSAYSCGSVCSPYAPPRGLEPHDIDMILARLLEGYRILDELFNPRSVRTRPVSETENPQHETNRP